MQMWEDEEMGMTEEMQNWTGEDSMDRGGQMIPWYLAFCLYWKTGLLVGLKRRSAAGGGK